ncbi:DUF7285 family protein [Natrarchaeobaculum sulfurireducens]|uniref:Pilin/flagellin n=1 Tax=Natrarchaeobaculum sulfurireducens TaxID=2044521 RepID=A0A346PQ45_9EURY|nr:hypothetical protein [Natrarchaeobaculum sulfurireducens]AXR81640.1 hypothetical protein AArcMg_1628 [Natrarchaeobaculum sulfurireducens]
MLRWSQYRAQTEPLAAIFAVSIFAIALSLYVVAAQPIFPGFSDDSTADRTIDRVWDDIEQHGVFHAYDGADDIDALVDGESVPAGSAVYVVVTAVDGGEEQPVAEAAFPSGYPDDIDPSEPAQIEQYVEDEGVPSGASISTRSIPVAVESQAEIRSGTLEVSVW